MAGVFIGSLVLHTGSITSVVILEWMKTESFLPYGGQWKVASIGASQESAMVNASLKHVWGQVNTVRLVHNLPTLHDYLSTSTHTTRRHANVTLPSGYPHHAGASLLQAARARLAGLSLRPPHGERPAP